MASVSELRSQIDKLQAELSELSPVTTKQVQVQTGTKLVQYGRSSRKVPTYATVNETIENKEYTQKATQLNKLRDQYQTEFVKQTSREGLDYLNSLFVPAGGTIGGQAANAALPATAQGATLPTFGLSRQIPATTYAGGFTPDLLRAPAAPTKQTALSKEQFFNQVYKPSIGGDAGLLSFFPSGGRGQGQVDGSPRVPTYDQFLKGQSTYSHRHDGKVYGMQATKDTSKAFNDAYNAYTAKIDADNSAAQASYDAEVNYNKAIVGIRDQAATRRLDATQLQQGLANLTAQRNFGVSDFANSLNFQVSDQQILDDLNNTRLSRLNSIVERGNAQVVGIQERIAAAQRLVQGLPQSDQRRKVADDAIASMQADLASVTSAISEANEKITNFRPVTAADQEGIKEINNFREFIKLPEERSLDQIRQIDPAAFSAAQSLTNQYQNLMGQTYESTLDPATQAARRATQDAFLRRANEDYGSSVDPNTLAFRRQVEQQIRDKVGENIPSFLNAQTEALRGTLEDDTLNQLRLGSLLDSDLQRQYQQASRAAQTARGNIFGVAPAVEEAVQTGMAGEARKAQRQAAAQSFLQSGQTRSDATALDRQLIEATRRNRLGDAASFFSSGQSAEDVLSRDRQLRDTMNRARGMDLANYLASGATAEDAVRLDLNFRNQQRLNNLGAAGNFLAAGPSLYNLANARTTGQQAAFQNYINANQANPGQFNPQVNQIPFYQTTNPSIPVNMSQTAANIYGSLADYQSRTYGAQVGALAQVASANSIPNYISAFSSLVPSFSFGR